MLNHNNNNEEKEDLREYDKYALSLIIFNDEALYNIRHWGCLIDVIHARFLYTSEQLEVLNEDLIEDLTSKLI